VVGREWALRGPLPSQEKKKKYAHARTEIDDRKEEADRKNAHVQKPRRRAEKDSVREKKNWYRSILVGHLATQKDSQKKERVYSGKGLTE